MSLSVMLASPHSVDLRPQMEDWLKSLQDLGKIDIYQNYISKKSMGFYFTFNIYI